MAKCECCGQEIKNKDVPGDLISQAEAAKLVSVATYTINRATRDGRLTTWEVDTPNPRKGKHQVSKSEVLLKFKGKNMTEEELLIEEMTNEAIEIAFSDVVLVQKDIIDGELHAQFQAMETAEIIRLSRKLN